MEETGQQAATYAGGGGSVFLAWLETPIGATLVLLLVVLGVGSVVMNVMHRSARVVEIMATIVLGLLFFYVVGGILEAMGYPVREFVQQLFDAIPVIGRGLGEWLMGEVAISQS